MMAFWVDWLMITEAPPCPVIVAAPPTTVPPSGPAATRATPSANSAVAVSNRLHRRGRRGCIVNVPRPSAQDQEEPLVPARARFKEAWHGVPIRALTCGTLRNEQIK